MKKVSIIVPVYNSEKYLLQCVSSAVNQTMRDIEIICVNDGSTDGSLQILKKMSEEDARIKVINKFNTGYGNTMNTGIDFATGKYLIFLESDDFIKSNMCEVLYELCEKYDLEILKTDFCEFKMKGKEVCFRYRNVSDYNNYHKILTPNKNTELFYASMYTWTCMYNLEFINKYKIRHNETPGASYQDNGFWFQSLMYCKRLYLLDQAFYMYRQDNPNASIYSREKVHAFSDEYAFIQKKIDEFSGDKETLLRICAFFNLHHNLISLKRVDKKYTEELIKLILEEFQEYNKRKAWNVKYLFEDFIKKVMVCMTQPDELKKYVWKYIEQDNVRKDILEKYNTYILYGAGKYAQRTLSLLEECKMWNKDILCGVTTLKKEDEEINGIKIREIREVLKDKEEALVIICVKKDTEYYQQMYHNLKKWGVKNIIHTNDLIVEDFWDEFIK